MENAELRDWVAEQTALLDPPIGWRPDTAAAVDRFHARAAARPPLRWPAWIAAAAASLALLAALPAGRGLAQQFWQFLTVPKVTIVRVNPWPEGVPSPQVNVIGRPLPPIPAKDLEEARWRVHYDPRLPRPGVLATAPKLYTTFPISAGTTVHTADLELALRKTGVTGMPVPPAWEGARLAVHTSPMVIAEWPDAALVQSLPLTLTAPAGFDFAAYSALVLRIVGVDPVEAARLAQRGGTAPPWLAPLSRDFDRKGEIEEITLTSGPATLLQQFTWDGSTSRITITWTAPDRVYVLTGTLTRDLAIALANAVQ
jgi:hypothetical protein